MLVNFLAYLKCHKIFDNITILTYVKSIISHNTRSFAAVKVARYYVYRVCDSIGHLPLNNNVYSGTCVLWTPWDQPKVSRLSRCPDFPGQFIRMIKHHLGP